MQIPVVSIERYITADQTDLLETLWLPFVDGALDEPGADRRAFFIRAEGGGGLPRHWRSRLVCEQTIREEFDALGAAGFETVTLLEGKFECGMCLATRHRRENDANVARGWELLEEGGTLVCAGRNEVGIKSMEKRLGKFVEIAGKISKNHCRVFWMRKTEPSNPFPEEWLELARPASHMDGPSFVTQPGIFSWNKVDRGSAFLLDSLPATIAGDVADFGAGWGFISHELLDRFERIKRIDLFENEKLALDAARLNVTDGRASFFWADLTGQATGDRVYDWVVTNPPFHTSSRTDITLGCRFIEVAARSLGHGGRLLLVANRQLPYEREVKRLFGEVERLAESADFKVLLASHPREAS